MKIELLGALPYKKASHATGLFPSKITIGTLSYIYLPPHKSLGFTDHKIMQSTKRKTYASKRIVRPFCWAKTVKQSKHKQIPSSNLDI